MPCPLGGCVVPTCAHHLSKHAADADSDRVAMTQTSGWMERLIAGNQAATTTAAVLFAGWIAGGCTLARQAWPVPCQLQLIEGKL